MYYLKEFSKAIYQTEKLGLKNGIKLDINPFYSSNSEILNMQKVILEHFYGYQKKELNDLRNNCCRYNYDLHLFLKNTYNINSDITIGNIYIEEDDKMKKYNFEELSNMTKRLNTNSNSKFGGHVWLTINGCYIADLTLFPSIWHERFIKNKDKKRLLKEEQEESFYKQVLFKSLTDLKNFPFKYNPIIVGEDYLRKAKLLT